MPKIKHVFAILLIVLLGFFVFVPFARAQEIKTVDIQDLYKVGNSNN